LKKRFGSTAANATFPREKSGVDIERTIDFLETLQTDDCRFSNAS